MSARFWLRMERAMDGVVVIASSSSLSSVPHVRRNDLICSQALMKAVTMPSAMPERTKTGEVFQC